MKVFNASVVLVHLLFLRKKKGNSGGISLLISAIHTYQLLHLGYPHCMAISHHNVNKAQAKFLACDPLYMVCTPVICPVLVWV